MRCHSIGRLAKLRKKQAKTVKAGKQKVSGTWDTVRSTLSRSNEGASWKRDIIEGRRRRDEIDQDNGKAIARGLPVEENDFPADVTRVAVQKEKNGLEVQR